MLVIIKDGTEPKKIDLFKKEMVAKGLIIQDILGSEVTMIGLAGNTAGISHDSIKCHDIVEKVIKVSEPYKLASRRFQPEETVVEVSGRKTGGGHFTVMAGPCSVESEEQILSIARDVRQSGASFLRGGAFKPRSSPYAFQGLGLAGLELMKIAREKTGLPIVTEIMSPGYADAFERDVDIIQIGARNMQNFDLLNTVGQLGKPVLLKRGPSCTIDELLMAAEYILKSGKSQVLLCERGIRTFETATRNTLDLSAVPVLKAKSHLPVIVDPSHGTGHWHLVQPMALAAVASGCDGLLIEVHQQPDKALCDGQQSLTPFLFDRLMAKISAIRAALDATADPKRQPLP